MTPLKIIFAFGFGMMLGVADVTITEWQFWPLALLFALNGILWSIDN
jgi:hypothetical protein